MSKYLNPKSIVVIALSLGIFIVAAVTKTPSLTFMAFLLGGAYLMDGAGSGESVIAVKTSERLESLRQAMGYASQLETVQKGLTWLDVAADVANAGGRLIKEDSDGGKSYVVFESGGGDTLCTFVPFDKIEKEKESDKKGVNTKDHPEESSEEKEKSEENKKEDTVS